MTENNPDRTIGGLPKRRSSPDLTGMLARNRSTESTEEQAASKAETQPPKQRIADHAPRKESDSADTGKKQITAYMSKTVRKRARAAFKATAHLEDDRSWSAFIEAAVLAEVERREQEYNDGQEYGGGDEALSPGRPIT